jgi:hypothetical protein
MNDLSRLKGAFAALGLALGTLASATIASADDNFGTIRGRVTLPDRTPVCGLRVTARSEHNMTLRARTQPDGSYVFLGALPGDYTVDFGTYEHIERRAHVSPMLTTTVDSPVPPTRYPKGLDANLKAAVLQQCPPPSYSVYAYYPLNGWSEGHQPTDR